MVMYFEKHLYDVKKKTFSVKFRRESNFCRPDFFFHRAVFSRAFLLTSEQNLSCTLKANQNVLQKKFSNYNGPNAFVLPFPKHNS